MFLSVLVEVHEDLVQLCPECGVEISVGQAPGPGLTTVVLLMLKLWTSGTKL
jgi:hypothetical protein